MGSGSADMGEGMILAVLWGGYHMNRRCLARNRRPGWGGQGPDPRSPLGPMRAEVPGPGGIPPWRGLDAPDPRGTVWAT